MDGGEAHGPRDAVVFVGRDGNVRLIACDSAPPDVLLAVIAAHRARVGVPRV